MNTQKTQNIFHCMVPEVCGYGVNGYGNTILESILECEKAYHKMINGYSDMWDGGEEYSNFTSAIDYFGGYVMEITIPSNGIDDGENIVNDGIDTIKIYNDHINKKG